MGLRELSPPPRRRTEVEGGVGEVDSSRCVSSQLGRRSPFSSSLLAKPPSGPPCLSGADGSTCHLILQQSYARLDLRATHSASHNSTVSWQCTPVGRLTLRGGSGRKHRIHRTHTAHTTTTTHTTIIIRLPLLPRLPRLPRLLHRSSLILIKPARTHTVLHIHMELGWRPQLGRKPRRG